MENQNPALPENGKGNNVSADTVDVTMSTVQNINATSVILRQAAVQSAKTDHMVVRQGGIAQANTSTLEMTQGGTGFVKANNANITASNAGVVVAGADIKMDLSAARVIVAGGEVSLDQSASVVIVGNTVKAQGSPVVFLIARKIEGNLATTFGPQESILFGAVAGLVAGVVLLLGNFFRRRKK
jgi:hypothetical protein